MKLCQDYSGKTLNEIAVHFNVSHYCTVSQTIGRLNRILKAGRRLQRELTTISQDLTPQKSQIITLPGSMEYDNSYRSDMTHNIRSW
jgi:hypothetical protein